MTQELSIIVHQVGVTIEHSRELAVWILCGLDAPCNVAECSGGVETIACIEKQHVISRCQAQSFVHRIIKSLVGFGHHHQFVGSRHCFLLLFPKVQVIEGRIF